MQLFKIVTFIFVILGHIYGAPSTNAVDEIERFLKSDVAHFYGMCDKALEITVKFILHLEGRVKKCFLRDNLLY